MSESDLRSQISAKEDDITKIEEEAAKKDASAEKEVDNEYDSKIADVKSNLDSEQAKLNEAIEKAAEWAAKKIELSKTVKVFSKEYKKLNNEKINALKTKLKQIETDKKTRIKPLMSEIRSLKKQLAALEKAASRE
ncbi:MAG: hypothetical protein ACFFHV_23210 [Promethearchaeota archaeon]